MKELACSLLSQDTGMLAWGPLLSPGSGAGCGQHQPPPPTPMSSRFMRMSKVGLPSFWSMARAGPAGQSCLSRAHFQGSELGLQPHLSPLFQEDGKKNHLKPQGTLKTKGFSPN